MFGIFGKKLPRQLRSEVEARLRNITQFCMHIDFDKTASELNPLLFATFDNEMAKGRLLDAMDDLPRLLKRFEHASPDKKVQVAKIALDRTLAPETFNDDDGPYYGVALMFIYYMAQIEAMIELRQSYKGERLLWEQLDSTANILSGAFSEITGGNSAAAARLVPLYFASYPLGYAEHSSGLMEDRITGVEKIKQGLLVLVLCSLAAAVLFYLNSAEERYYYHARSMQFLLIGSVFGVWLIARGLWMNSRPGRRSAPSSAGNPKDHGVATGAENIFSSPEATIGYIQNRNETFHTIGEEMAEACLANWLKAGKFITISQIKEMFTPKFGTNGKHVAHGFLIHMLKYVENGEVISIERENDDAVLIHRDHFKDVIDKGFPADEP